MKLQVDQPGLLTTVQDLGRWGYLGQGMPLAGAMDPLSLRTGNLMVGNSGDMAALEITLLGPSITVLEEEATGVVAGADLGLAINGEKWPCWKCFTLRSGDRLTFSGPAGKGCRAYLCFSGGIEARSVMGSRSTYLRGKLGGYSGRALQKGDTLTTGKPHPLWKRLQGFRCPSEMLPPLGEQNVLKAVPGPQDYLFTEKGLETFFSSEYTITSSADRMGYRLEGPVIEHREGADIISDAIPPGAVQVPGSGQPIIMLADGQTTGGYAKIAVITSMARCALAQLLPGGSVRFQRISQKEAISEARQIEMKLNKLKEARAVFSTRQKDDKPALIMEEEVKSGSMKLKIDEKNWDIQWELIE
jgi:biotin-dependent carboxylase-like uncharacterized protein